MLYDTIGYPYRVIPFLMNTTLSQLPFETREIMRAER